MNYIKRANLFSLALLAAVAAPSYAVSNLSAKDSVSNLITCFVQWDGKSTDKNKLDQLAHSMDYDGMSQRALGTVQWAKLSAPQKSEFITALRNVIELRYYPRWHRLFTKGTVVYGVQTKKQTETTIETKLTVGKSKQNLSWLLDEKGGELKVVSLKVDKSDLVTRLHDRISTRLAKSGFDKVLAWLKSKSADVGDDSSTGGQAASK
ncbi:MAG: ABC transporter substrate-binding protein [Candidatus Obscuribacterales bacterium]|nr:ABC transporter substrate-binding protein [Candidatus Obscuribacterales bacterium]